MFFKKSLLVFTVATIYCGSSFSGNAADLSVSGGAVAFTPGLQVGSLLDDGNADATILYPATSFALSWKTIDYVVTCSTATKNGIEFMGARHGSVYVDGVTQSDGSYGVGLAGDAKAGYYSIVVGGAPAIDVVDADAISTENSGGSWFAIAGLEEFSYQTLSAQ